MMFSNHTEKQSSIPLSQKSMSQKFLLNNLSHFLLSFLLNRFWVIGDPSRGKLTNSSSLFCFCFVLCLFVCLFFWLELAPPHWNFLSKLKKQTNKQTNNNKTNLSFVHQFWFFFFSFLIRVQKRECLSQGAVLAFMDFPQYPPPQFYPAESPTGTEKF